MASLGTETSSAFQDLNHQAFKRSGCDSISAFASLSEDTGSDNLLQFAAEGSNGTCDPFMTNESNHVVALSKTGIESNLESNKPKVKQFSKKLLSLNSINTNGYASVPLITSQLHDDKESDEEVNVVDSSTRPLIADKCQTLDKNVPNGKYNLCAEQDKRISQQLTTSDYSSYSSCDSSMNIVASNAKDSINKSLKTADPTYPRDVFNDANYQTDSERNTLIVRDVKQLDPQPTTPNGSCLKAGSKASTGGVHVQFETTADIQGGISLRESPDLAKEKEATFAKLWARIQPPESSDYTPFSSLRKHRKKRSRQPSGSSTASIGSSSTSLSETARTTEFERRAPDGGWGWVVVFASFMVHCIADGVTMSFGVLYVEFLAYFDESKSLTSWIGSLFMAIPLLAGPLASTLTDRYGCRAVTMCGAVVACIGFFFSAFANSIPVLFITVGLITGIGLAVCYVAAIVIVAFYFEKRRSLATGLAVAGSGIGTFIFAPIIQYLLEYFGWRGCLVVIAGIFLNMAVCGALMRDLEWTKKRTDKVTASNTTFSSGQGSANQSTDTINANAVPGSTLPSLCELKRLVQSGDIACLLSPDDPPMYVARSESLVLLPTYLNQSQKLPNDLMPYLASKANAYELVSHVYPHLLAYNLSQSELQPSSILQQNTGKTSMPQLPFQEDEQDLMRNCSDETTKTVPNGKLLLKEDIATSPSWLNNDAVEASKETLIRNGKPSHHQVVPRRSSCLGSSAPSLPVAPLRDMRITRHSMTFRGAMLNIHRYRLRASSCPNIFRNSIITIAESEDQNIWSYFKDLRRMIASCLDLKYCADGPFLVFALSNFILYVFYDTVYMYLTDYAQGVGIPPEKGANLISAIGILNCIGMIFMGYIGDKPWSSPMLIYNISMIACGLSVIVMPFITNYWMLATASAVFGLFISANYALTAVILVELISLEAFSKSYGLLLLIQGIANLIGPPLVGYMADATGNYTIPFVVSGISIVLCGVLLSLIPVIQKYRLRKLADKNSSAARFPSEDRSTVEKTNQSGVINV